MAQRKTVAVGDDLRTTLAAREREWHAQLCDFAEQAGWVGSGSTTLAAASWHLNRAGALDRREPVEVRGWELPLELLPPGSADAQFVIEADGSLTPVLGDWINNKQEQQL